MKSLEEVKVGDRLVTKRGHYTVLANRNGALLAYMSKVSSEVQEELKQQIAAGQFGGKSLASVILQMCDKGVDKRFDTVAFATEVSDVLPPVEEELKAAENDATAKKQAEKAAKDAAKEAKIAEKQKRKEEKSKPEKLVNKPQGGK
jgi:hypothetical protein